MADANLPSPGLLSRLLCSVTETMWSLQLGAAAAVQDTTQRVPGRAVALQLAGEPDFTVLVGWDVRDDAALQVAFCGELGPDAGGNSAGSGPLRDAIGELVNIIAGQIKSELALEHRLGLPTGIATLPAPVAEALGRSACSRLRTPGADLSLFVGAFPTRDLGVSA